MRSQQLSVPRLAAGALTVLLFGGCGGGGAGGSSSGGGVMPTYSLGGTVSGLAGTGLAIQDASGGALSISANGAFTLPHRVPAGTAYTIVVATQPSNPVQTCTVAGGSGTVVQADVAGITVSCTTDPLTSRFIDLATAGELYSITPDVSRHRIYLAAPNRNEVVVLDADTYLILDHYFVGSAPKALALSADGSKLYVGLNYGGALVVVNLNTQTLTTIPVSIQLGTPIVECLTEVRPNIVLVGGSAVGNVQVNLITVDLNNAGAQQIVATQVPLSVANTLVKSPDGRVVFGLGMPYPYVPSAEVMFRIDATQPGLPIVASVPVNLVTNLAVSRDGGHLLTNGGGAYDAVSLQRLWAWNYDGAVGETPDGAVIMQSPTSGTVGQRDSVTFAVLTLYNDDCPAGVLLDAIAPAQLRGEWIKTIELTKLCVVSTSNPTTAPGVSGSRTLPPWIPDPVLVPSVVIPDGAVNDVVIDSVRGVAYVANGLGQSVDIYSLAQQAIVGSIAVGGKPQVVTLSSDDTTVYAGLFDQGVVVGIDLTSHQVTQRVALTAMLGTPDIIRMVEIAPGHLLVSSIPAQGGLGPNTYLVDVIMSDPTSPHRVGCALGYNSAAAAVRPDRHYLYVINAIACPPEKRDLTLPGYPVVVSGPAGGYIAGGAPVVTADGAYLISGGVIIDTSTMQQTAYPGAGGALASQNPDRFYLLGTTSIVTMELHDLKILSVAANGCPFSVDGLGGAAMSADEKTFITNLVGGALCVTRIAP